jgi:hypothetical protein
VLQPPGSAGPDRVLPLRNFDSSLQEIRLVLMMSVNQTTSLERSHPDFHPVARRQGSSQFNTGRGHLKAQTEDQ